jgi:hypothetical protein
MINFCISLANYRNKLQGTSGISKRLLDQRDVCAKREKELFHNTDIVIEDATVKASIKEAGSESPSQMK